MGRVRSQHDVEEGEIADVEMHDSDDSDSEAKSLARLVGTQLTRVPNEFDSVAMCVRSVSVNVRGIWRKNGSHVQRSTYDKRRPSISHQGRPNCSSHSFHRQLHLQATSAILT